MNDVLRPSDRKRKFVVVGGGQAEMEASRLLFHRYQPKVQKQSATITSSLPWSATRTGGLRAGRV
jgi:hypothetical protein